MKLIPDWKKAWRFFSMQAMVLAGAIQTTWATLPPDMKAAVPDWGVTVATVALLVAGVLGRLVDQD